MRWLRSKYGIFLIRCVLPFIEWLGVKILGETLDEFERDCSECNDGVVELDDRGLGGSYFGPCDCPRGMQREADWASYSDWEGRKRRDDHIKANEIIDEIGADAAKFGVKLRELHRLLTHVRAREEDKIQDAQAVDDVFDQDKQDK